MSKSMRTMICFIALVVFVCAASIYSGTRTPITVNKYLKGKCETANVEKRCSKSDLREKVEELEKRVEKLEAAHKLRVIPLYKM